ncbi:protein lplB [Paenibacillus swuensis]|uniref:Protein lplB n=1 Tax=Paenibacillus swuensis TaxID=1178515 RepID=A0A172TN06_9BACL|nr:ABC transporter permease subunit [Paenibacillus swuensis]ANE48410.1 protein lplB [Paenibacillus swuensis]
MNNKVERSHYHLMLLPGILLLLIFSIYPMFGVILAFKQFNPVAGIWGSPWIGFEHFRSVFNNPLSFQVVYNTLFIATAKIIANNVASLVFALLLNEVRIRWFKRTVQTVVYLPYFLSWVILAGMFKDMFSNEGLINKTLGLMGVDAITFLGSNAWFPAILVGTDTWKDFGFGAIIYLAALTNINPNLYEASAIDGANRWQNLKYITLPSLTTTIILLATLSMQGVLNAGFEQVLNMYNVVVYESGDIIDTYVYRLGLSQAQYEIATAIGLFKSVVSFILIGVSSYLAYRFANYRIF